jgi:hypothetical protein
MVDDTGGIVDWVVDTGVMDHAGTSLHMYQSRSLRLGPYSGTDALEPGEAPDVGIWAKEHWDIYTWNDKVCSPSVLCGARSLEQHLLVA